MKSSGFLDSPVSVRKTDSSARPDTPQPFRPTIQRAPANFRAANAIFVFREEREAAAGSRWTVFIGVEIHLAGCNGPPGLVGRLNDAPVQKIKRDKGGPASEAG